MTSVGKQTRGQEVRHDWLQIVWLRGYVIRMVSVCASVKGVDDIVTIDASPGKFV